MRNRRVFHIALGDQIVRKDFDINEGGIVCSTPIYIPFEVTSSGKVIYNKKFECANAYDLGTSSLSFFLQPKVEHPKIDGLILFKGELEGIFEFEGRDQLLWAECVSEGVGRAF